MTACPVGTAVTAVLLAAGPRISPAELLTGALVHDALGISFVAFTLRTLWVRAGSEPGTVLSNGRPDFLTRRMLHHELRHLRRGRMGSRVIVELSVRPADDHSDPVRAIASSPQYLVLGTNDDV